MKSSYTERAAQRLIEAGRYRVLATRKVWLRIARSLWSFVAKPRVPEQEQAMHRHWL